MCRDSSSTQHWEALVVAASAIGQGDLHLADDAAVQAFDARHGQDQPDRLAADGQGAETPHHLAPAANLPRSTGTGSEAFEVLGGSS